MSVVSFFFFFFVTAAVWSAQNPNLTFQRKTNILSLILNLSPA